MANRGRQTFNKRLKEQQRKEKQQEKFARRIQRKTEKDHPEETAPDQEALIPDTEIIEREPPQ